MFVCFLDFCVCVFVVVFVVKGFSHMFACSCVCSLALLIKQHQSIEHVCYKVPTSRLWGFRTICVYKKLFLVLVILDSYWHGCEFKFWQSSTSSCLVVLVKHCKSLWRRSP